MLVQWIESWPDEAQLQHVITCVTFRTRSCNVKNSYIKRLPTLCAMGFLLLERLADR